MHVMTPEHADRAGLQDPYTPSEYTVMMLRCLRETPALVADRHVCEIGTGSGVIAAQAAALGAARITATDIEVGALAPAAERIRAAGAPGLPVETVAGSLWAPLEGQRFDTVLANLPHFPAALQPSGRLPSWLSGGTDGRRFLDPFIDGLDAHMATGGRALFTHSRFVSLDRTRERLARNGLDCAESHRTCILLPPEKSAAFGAETLSTSPAIFSFGEYHFAEICLVTAWRASDPAP